MNTHIRSALVAASFGALVGLPHAALAQADQHYQLTARILEVTPGVGEYDGALQLTIGRDGIVNGYYRPNDGRFVAVTGGLQGDRLWLQIGAFAAEPLEFTGTLKGGTIEADAFVDDRSLRLEATPTISQR